MKLRELVSDVRSAVQNGISADDSRFDALFIENKIHNARAIIISNYLSMGRSPNSIWIQEIDHDVLERDEECGVVYFECPSVITVDATQDGFIYVGHKNGMQPFTRIVQGRSNLGRHSRLKNVSEILWEYSFGLQGRSTIACYKNPRLENLKTKGIFNDPTLVPNFRKDLDEYPVDRNVARDIIEMIAMDLLRGSRVPTDYVSDGADKPTK